ncbi:unnamed protein product, partial [Nesidiocoris tenuis]
VCLLALAAYVTGQYHGDPRNAAILTDSRYLNGDGKFGAAYSQASTSEAILQPSSRSRAQLQCSPSRASLQPGPCQGEELQPGTSSAADLQPGPRSAATRVQDDDSSAAQVLPAWQAESEQIARRLQLHLQQSLGRIFCPPPVNTSIN